MDSWVWLGATEGGLVAAGGMRLYPLAGQPLGFGYLCGSANSRVLFMAHPPLSSVPNSVHVGVHVAVL